MKNKGDDRDCRGEIGLFYVNNVNRCNNTYKVYIYFISACLSALAKVLAYNSKSALNYHLFKPIFFPINMYSTTHEYSTQPYLSIVLNCT